jgi:hypothetical protein
MIPTTQGQLIAAERRSYKATIPEFQNGDRKLAGNTCGAV